MKYPSADSGPLQEEIWPRPDHREHMSVARIGVAQDVTGTSGKSPTVDRISICMQHTPHFHSRTRKRGSNENRLVVDGLRRCRCSV